MANSLIKGKKTGKVLLFTGIAVVAALIIGLVFIINNRPSADTDPWASQRTRPTTSLVDKLFAGYHSSGADDKWGNFENYTTQVFSGVSSDTPNLGTALANRFISDAVTIKDSPRGNSISAQFWVSFSRETQGNFEALVRVVKAQNNGVFTPEAATQVVRFFSEQDGVGIPEIADNFDVPVEFTLFKNEDGSTKTITFDNGNWSVSELASGGERFVSAADLQGVGGDVGIISFDVDGVSGETMSQAIDFVRALEAELPAGRTLTNEERQQAADYFVAHYSSGMAELVAMEVGYSPEGSDLSGSGDGTTPEGSTLGTSGPLEEVGRGIRQATASVASGAPSWKGSGTIAVNLLTGSPEYRTTLCYDPTGEGDNCIADGYFSFDPSTNRFSAEASTVFAGKEVSLYSDPVNGDVYMAFSKEDQTALYSTGKIQLMSAVVSSNGRFGGEFKYGNRVFKYNPNSGSFEVPIAVGRGGSFRFAQKGDTSTGEGGRGDWGTIYVDSKGNVSGRVDVLDGQASVFFDRSGRIAVAANIRAGGQSLGSVGIDSKGNISGSIDVGKAIGFNSVFVSLGSGGITGVTVPIGSYLGNAIGVGIGRNGAISIGGFIPIAGLPIPIGMSQDAHGGFRLTWPGGNLGIIEGDDRPLRAPELSKDEDGNVDTGCIYFRHSYKKLFQTIRVYQSPCTKIEKEEQVERGSMIFAVYNDILDRNPGLQEFMHWYFYSGHQLYKFPQHEKDKAYRMEETERRLRMLITCKGDYARANEGMTNSKDVCNEYKWINAGKAPLDAPTRPTDIMQSNPFDESSWENVENTSDNGVTTLSPVISFLEALLEDMRNDPGHYLSGYFDDKFDEVTADNQINIDYDITDSKLEDIETILLTRQGDYPIIEKTKDNNNLIITLRKGFNEVFTPQEVGYVNVAGSKNDGLNVFEYDPTYNTDPNKSWNTNISTLKPGTGYYIFNKGEEGRKIRLAKRADVPAGEKDTVMKNGWNLLAHSGSDPLKLGDYSIEVSNENWSGGCDIEGLCTESATLKELVKIDKDESRAHNTVYFLVPETDPLKLKKLVSTDVTESGRLNTIELKLGQMFWVYLYE